jgi:hypothetical protein
MKKVNLIGSRPGALLIVTTISSLSYLISVNNNIIKGFCYDRINGGLFCFEKENRSEMRLLQHEIA